MWITRKLNFQPKYHNGDYDKMLDTLKGLKNSGCKFIVGARAVNGKLTVPYSHGPFALFSFNFDNDSTFIPGCTRNVVFRFLKTSMFQKVSKICLYPYQRVVFAQMFHQPKYGKRGEAVRQTPLLFYLDLLLNQNKSF